MDLTIIVPVYNNEKYVLEALSSLNRQGELSMEAIVVDDGSTDGTGSLIDEFSENHPFIRVIHQKNQGVSIARNTALDLAEGDYIGFLDSDDQYCDGALPAMLSIAKKHDPDLIVGESLRITPFSSTSFKNSRIMSEKDIIPQDDPAMVYNFSVCNKLFRRATIENHRLRFENIRHLEDGLFLFEFVAHADRMVGCHMPVYQYYQRISIQRKSILRGMDKEMFHDALMAIDRIREISKYWSVEFNNSLNNRLLQNTFISQYYRRLWLYGDDLFNELSTSIKKQSSLLSETQRLAIKAQLTDLEIDNHLKNRLEISDNPLLTILIPEGSDTEELAATLETLYYQKCPNFEVVLDRSYEPFLNSVYTKMENFHFQDLPRKDLLPAISNCRGRYLQVVDHPCIYNENSIALGLRVMLRGARDFLSLRMIGYREDEDEYEEFPLLDEIFTKEATKDRKKDTVRQKHNRLDHYSVNKIFDKERLLDQFSGEKIGADDLGMMALRDLTYRRYDRTGIALFSSLIRQDLSSMSPVSFQKGFPYDDFSMEIIPVSEYFPLSSLRDAAKTTKRQWIRLNMPGYRWEEDSTEKIEQYLTEAPERCSLLLCRRSTNEEDPFHHPLDYEFNRGSRINDIIDEPRTTIDTLAHLVFRTEDLRAVLEYQDENITEIEFLNAFLLRYPKIGVVKEASLVVDSNLSQPKVLGSKALLSQYQRMVQVSRYRYQKTLPFTQHMILFDLHQRDLHDRFFDKGKEYFDLLQCIDEKVISKAKVYKQDEKASLLSQKAGLNLTRHPIQQKNRSLWKRIFKK